MRHRAWEPAIGVAALLFIGGACTSSGSDSDGGAAAEQTIGLRAPGPIDTGVIESYEQEAMPEDTPVELSPDGLAAELTACHQIGIEQWLWQGTITLPEDVDEATVELHLGSHWDDAQPQFWTLTAHVRGSGRFAIERVQDLEPIAPADDAVIDMGIDASGLPADLTDRFVACNLSTARADVPLRSDAPGSEIDASHAERSIAVEADEGTIDALANGAHLGDHTGGRLPFAYLAAYEQPLPFDQTVVPDLDEVAVDEILWWTPTEPQDCPLIWLTGPVSIQQTDTCVGPPQQGRRAPTDPPPAPDVPVVGLEGWVWRTDPDGERSLRGQVDGWWVRVGQYHDPEETGEELIAIARSLHTVRNARVAEWGT